MTNDEPEPAIDIGQLYLNLRTAQQDGQTGPEMINFFGLASIPHDSGGPIDAHHPLWSIKIRNLSGIQS
jgi:hypothetical protein